jgi:hypothetical protein
MKLEIESRHSDYGADAGGYRVLRLDGAYVGRVEDYAVGEALVKVFNAMAEEIAVLKQDRTIIVTPPFPFLHSDFLTLMNDIGRLGHEKFGADAFEAAGSVRRIPRHQRDAIIYHIRGHLTNYMLGIPHDKLDTLQAHLAAAAFNCMLEYIFAQREQAQAAHESPGQPWKEQ